MMQIKDLYHTLQRTRTLESDRIYALPIAILMPHSACNCRCVMCDIWKDNKNLKQLTEADISNLLSTFKKLGTQQVLMSGGEALLNPNFFKLCELLKPHKISVVLLTTGLSVRKHAYDIIKYIDELIVSLDGDEHLHDQIRNIPQAFRKMKEGLDFIRFLKPDFKITARTVIHRMNYQKWPDIVQTARSIGIQQISFLPADVSSHAFNRQMAWETPRQNEVLIQESELPELIKMVNKVVIISRRHPGLVAESDEKLYNIYRYYAAFYGLNPFPFKKCNAPWVSTVIEADGSVKPCFFHESMGNIREKSLNEILNTPEAIAFRKLLKTGQNETCARCVCSLNLPPSTRLN
jgi:MoaA/NifB/PqqE/SkfB family radical SAM enzyme